MSTVLDTVSADGDLREPSTGEPPRRSRGPRYRTEPSPWRRSHTYLPLALSLVGAVLLAICWVGVSGELAWREQIGWLVGAMFATGLVVIGGALYLLIGLREVRRAIRHLKAERVRVYGLDALTPAAAAVTGWVRAPGMTRRHRADCLLMRGKPADPLTDAELAGLAACGVCSGGEQA